MFVVLTPIIFLFILFYALLFLSLLIVNSFFFGWVLIEFLLFVFIGIRFCIMRHSFSFILMYFLIQAISSFSMLVFYRIVSINIFTFFVLIKLSLFPFLFWFVNVSYLLPNFVFFMAATFQKFPVFYLLKTFKLPYSLTMFIFSLIISLLWVGATIVFLSSFRIIMSASSISSNLWFFISCYSNFLIIFSFFFIYSLSLFLVFNLLGSSLKPIRGVNFDYMFILFVNLSGLPPLPLFWVKLAIVFRFISCTRNVLFLYFLLVIYSLTMYGYFQYSLKFLVYKYSNSCYYLWSL